VAKLAGVPHSLLGDAQEKLDILESDKSALDISIGQGGLPRARAQGQNDSGNRNENDFDDGKHMPGQVHEPSAQISMFSFAPNPVIERLNSLDLMEITPSAAFAILEELKKAAEDNI
jgi:DNA mismatch repair ATPase MutS